MTIHAFNPEQATFAYRITADQLDDLLPWR